MVLFLSQVSFGQPNQIDNWSFVEQVYSALNEDDTRLWMATSGGVFQYTGGEYKKYQSSEGLGGVDIRDVVKTASGQIIAITEQGVISEYQASTDDFRIQHQNFANGVRQVLPQGLLAMGSYLVVGFNRELSIFDIAKNRSIYTLTRFQNTFLKESPLQGLAIKSSETRDTLFAYTENEVYWTLVNTSNVDQSVNAEGDFINMADPNIWTLMSSSDSNEFSPTRSPFEENQTSDSAEVWSVGGLEFPIPPTQVPQTVAVEFDSKIWVMGQSSTIQSWDQSNWQSTILQGMPFQYLNEVAANLGNQVFITSLTDDTSGLVGVDFYQLYNESDWIYQGRDELFGDGPATSRFNVKSLVLDQSGVFNGGWGGGVSYLANGQSTTGFSLGLSDGNTSPCLELSGNFNTVVLGAEYIEWLDEIALLVLDMNGGTRVVFRNSANEYDCFSLNRGDIFTRSIYAVDESVLILTPTELLRVEFGDTPSNRNPDIQTLTSTTHLGRKISVKQDQRDRIWVLSDVGLSLYCTNNDDSGLCPESVVDSLLLLTGSLNLPDVDYTTLEVDSYGNLWMGSEAGLTKVSASKGQLSSQDVQTWNSISGLADNRVVDLSINTASGSIWVAHKSSLSRLNSDARVQPSSDLTQEDPFIYPSPFVLGKHEQATIVNIPNESEVLILNSSRSIVKEFNEFDIQGGFIYWDGKNSRGRFIASGVYYLMVKEPGGKSHLKKFIVI